ncbi:MAG: DUF4386 domain-containing protein [Myxococcales bacterium]|nr:DUF4386 domain-containing protein [Myxococcales bacterium]
MPTQPTEASQRAAARIAGVVFLITVVGWTLNWVFVDSKIVVAGDAAKTLANLRADEFLFRLGLANELLFACCGIVLAFALFVIMERVNRNLAMLALGLKLVEAVLGSSLVLSGYIGLRMLNATAAPLDEAIGQFLTVRSTGMTVVMVFLGLDLVLFFSLLFKSRYVPRALSALGVFSYALILVQSVIGLLVPAGGAAQTMVTTMSMALFAPSVLFELLIGGWLLIKGLKLDPAGTLHSPRAMALPSA